MASAIPVYPENRYGAAVPRPRDLEDSRYSSYFDELPASLDALLDRWDAGADRWAPAARGFPVSAGCIPARRGNGDRLLDDPRAREHLSGNQPGRSRSAILLRLPLHRLRGTRPVERGLLDAEATRFGGAARLL